MNEVQRERLTRLRYVMEQMTRPPSQRAGDIGLLSRSGEFDITIICEIRNGWFSQEIARTCVVGCAMLDPVLQAQGLGYDLYLRRFGNDYIRPTINGKVVRYMGQELADFFGVHYDDWEALVHHTGYAGGADATAEEAVRKIDYLLMIGRPGARRAEPARREVPDYINFSNGFRITAQDIRDGDIVISELRQLTDA
jgi:hypothetical protein